MAMTRRARGRCKGNESEREDNSESDGVWVSECVGEGREVRVYVVCVHVPWLRTEF